MSRRKQHRIKNFSGCWTEPDITAFAVWFITASGFKDLRSGIGVAVGVVFGPMAIAMRGGTVEEVEKAIALSQTTFETYMFHARTYVGNTEPIAAPPAAPIETAAPPPPPPPQTHSTDHVPEWDPEVPLSMGDD